MNTVLVLGGGPDAERPVSIASAREVASALRGRYRVEERTIDRLTPAELRSLPGDVVFPALHGRWGEGGPLQDLLEADGRPYVGSGPCAARAAMDKVATLVEACQLGIPTTGAAVLDVRDDAPPIDPPLVVKPVHDGSSVGLFICQARADWDRALATIRAEEGAGVRRSYMVQRYVRGEELTVGVLDGRALPAVRIEAAGGVYDYGAKYERDDTRYVVDPPMDAGVARSLAAWSESLCAGLGVRHVARVDYILPLAGPDAGVPMLLEVNTMPGFTTHSLVPMAARAAGLSMEDLCASLVEMAVRDRGVPRDEQSEARAF